MERSLFSEEHQAVRHLARDFTRSHVEPNLDRWSEAGIVDREVFTAAGSLGLLGMDVEENMAAVESTTSATTSH